jgi:hypothetical protein
MFIANPQNVHRPTKGKTHFTTRPGESRDKANVPITSLVSVSRAVSTIVVSVIEPMYAAGWESGTSPTRIGPPRCRTNVPGMSNSTCALISATVNAM